MCDEAASERSSAPATQPSSSGEAARTDGLSRIRLNLGRSLMLIPLIRNVDSNLVEKLFFSELASGQEYTVSTLLMNMYRFN